MDSVEEFFNSNTEAMVVNALSSSRFWHVLEMKNGIIHVLDFLSFLNYK